MPSLGFSYNPTEHDPDTRPEPIPAGEYELMIIGTDVRTTKDGAGSYLYVEHEVTAGAHQGRKIIGQITLENRNAQAVEIGQRQLSALCHAAGWLDPLLDSDVLHGRTCRAKVGIEPAKGEYAAKNKIVAYVLPNARGSEAAPAAARKAPAPSSGGSKSPPWERNR